MTPSPCEPASSLQERRGRSGTHIPLTAKSPASAPIRIVLTLLLLTLSMLLSSALGSPEPWMLIAIGMGWAPLLALVLVPLLMRTPLLILRDVRRPVRTCAARDRGL